MTFATPTGVMDYSPESGAGKRLLKRPSKLWGAGMLAYTLAETDQISVAREVAADLDAYRKSDGTLSSLPGGSEDQQPRMAAHAVLGLARTMGTKQAVEKVGTAHADGHGCANDNAISAIP